MSLKGDLKKTLLDVLKANGDCDFLDYSIGMPPVIDKTFNDIWTAFAKTQPSALNKTFLETSFTDVWGNLELSLSKYGVDPKYAKSTVTKLKKKFGETPSINEIKAFMSGVKIE